MSHISLPTKAHIQKHLKDFLKGFPIEHSLEPNCRHVSFYRSVLRTICETFCSSSALAELDVDVGSAARIHNGLQADISKVALLQLDNPSRTSIKKTLAKKRGISFVYVKMIAQNSNAKHACLMVFDASTRKQHFFNPWGYTNHWLQRAIADRPPFVEGFQVASVYEDSWQTDSLSLQGKFDRAGVGPNEAGNCGVWIVLVCVLCLRFGVGEPKLMATLFMTETIPRGRPIAGEFTTRLWTWMTSMERPVNVLSSNNSTPAGKKAARQELTAHIFHSDATTLCGMYCPKSDTVCVRKSCPGDVFCWQHRFFVRNKDKRGRNKMKCSATQARCLRR